MTGRDSCDDGELGRAALRSLSRLYPSVDAALAEIARLSAERTLPKGVVHVISDVHGEYAKLRHIINNASGALRPVVEHVLGERLGANGLAKFLPLLFYPHETFDQVEATFTDAEQRRAFVRKILDLLFVLARHLAGQGTFARVQKLLPAEYRGLFEELLYAGAGGTAGFVAAIVEPLLAQGRAFQFLRLTARLIRNLAVDELVLGGDFWDRGPRGDRVVEYLMRQPNVSITWGNHDAAWIGACLGHEALIAHVLRISARYRRFAQLEEGYGITLQPLEHLVRNVYADDPATCYTPRGTGLRETSQMARMHKAAAIMQFKLEGQLIERRPEFELANRRLLHRIDFAKGTVTVDDKAYPLKDTHFPTVDPAHPYALSSAERACLDRLKQSFLSSRVLWEQINYVIDHGGMYLSRDDHLIFHGCVPVDERAEFQTLPVDGRPRRGRELFEALTEVVIRARDRRDERDLDMLWYLWCGPRSPLFGKDRIATFEIDLIADKRAHAEIKNPYFHLLHESDFCDKVLAEFGVDAERGLIVNGHVPVKLEQGESPLKRSGKAITIDGAFSEAYGDHGYTLVLEPERTYLAKHHHFESVEAAVRDGIDIIPEITEVRRWPQPRRIADTERGREIAAQIRLLEQLVDAYRHNRLRPTN